MKNLLIIAFACFCLMSKAQDILPNANTIVVKGVNFNQICITLLDSGYNIEKKDAELLTIKTEPKVYPKMYNAAYIINVRVKDSTAYFTGTFTAPWADPFTRNANKMEPLWKDEKIYNHCNKKGKPYPKSLAGYPFHLINKVALSFGKEVLYQKL